jgi:hypothetical protein
MIEQINSKKEQNMGIQTLVNMLDETLPVQRMQRQRQLQRRQVI